MDIKRRRQGHENYLFRQADTSLRIVICLSRIYFIRQLKQAPAPDSDRFPIEPGARVADVLEKIGAPIEEAKLIFINNKRGELSTVLNDGDRVGGFPPVGGG